MTFRWRTLAFVILSVPLSVLIFYQLTRSLLLNPVAELGQQAVYAQADRLLLTLKNSNAVVDEQKVQQVARQLDLNASVYSTDAPNLPPDVGLALNNLSPQSPIYVRVDGLQASVYVLVENILGEQTLIVRVDMPRNISARIQNGQRMVVIFLGVWAFASLALLLSFLYWSVNRPMQTLYLQVRDVRRTGDYSLRIPGHAKGAFALLTAELNNLLSDISKVRQPLTQRGPMDQQLSQLRMAQQFIQALGNVQSMDELYHNTIRLFSERFGLYYAGIFLVDEARGSAVLRGSSLDSVPTGYRLQVDSASTVGMAIVRGQLQRADVGVRKDRPSFTRLPMARTEIAVPIHYRSQIYGAIALQSTQPDAFIQSEDQVILQQLADYVGLVINRISQQETLQAELRRMENLHNQYLTEHWTEELRLQDVLRATYQPGAVSQGEIHSLEMPLMLHGARIGTVVIESEHKNWSQEERELIDALLAQAVQSLENARLLERSQRRAAQERLVAQIVHSVRASSDIDMILRTSALELGRSLHASRADVRIQPNAGDILLQTIETLTDGAGVRPEAVSGNGHPGPVSAEDDDPAAGQDGQTSEEVL